MKAPNGEGSVFSVEIRGKTRWKAQVSLGKSPQGKRRYATKTAETEAKARKMLREMLADRDSGRLSQRQHHTVSTFGLYWAREIKPLEVRPTTAATYEYLLRRYVFPNLGAIRLSDLRATHVQDLLSDLHQMGYATSTVNHARTALMGMCSYAERLGLISHNPVIATRRQRSARSALDKRRMAWTTDEARHALTALGADDLVGCYLTIALSLGLRPGEILGLRWVDVDEDHSLIHVTGTLKEARIILPSGRGVVRQQRNDPKTSASMRSLPLTPRILAALKQQSDKQRFQRVVNPRWQESGYVLTTKNGTPYSNSNFRRMFQSRLDQAGLRRVTLHSLRHTVAATSLEGGSAIEDVSQALGHTRIDTTKQIYAGYVPQLNVRFAENIDRQWRPTHSDGKSDTLQPPRM